MSVLLAVVIAALVAAMAGSSVVLVQAFINNSKNTRYNRQRMLLEIAKELGGTVTAARVADRLRLTVPEAERLLRGMVDDEHLEMRVDDREGVVVYWFPKLTPGPFLGATSQYSRVRRPGAPARTATPHP